MKAIILAAGYASRLYPLTKNEPKSLLKVGNKTIKLTVINDGTLSNDDRLGALGDIQHVINTAHVQDDLMIAAGDNLFGFSLVDLVTFYKAHDGNAISIYKEADSAQLIRGGIADIDNEGRVIGFVEKPEVVNYPYAVPTFYIIQKDDLHLFNAYQDEGNNMDANGNFIPYLLDHSKVYGFVFYEYRYDIGTLESYEQVQKLFAD